MLRLLTAMVLFHSTVGQFVHPIPHTSTVLGIIGACAGLFLLIGLWTPLAGTLIALLEVWITFSFAANPLTHIMLATLGATLAMIGPGAWSIDARLFGRKRIEAPRL